MLEDGSLSKPGEIDNPLDSDLFTKWIPGVIMIKIMWQMPKNYVEY